MPTVECQHCGQAFQRHPSHAKRHAHQFCSHACAWAWQNVKVQVSCSHCGATRYRSPSAVARHKKAYCSPGCYYKSRQQFYSTYPHRGLEATPRQKLVRFLVSHGVGQSGYPGESLIVLAKSNFYTSEAMPHFNPILVLADELRKLGHTRLAHIDDGSWQDEKNWLVYQEGWFHRPRNTMPWERDDW